MAALPLSWLFALYREEAYLWTTTEASLKTSEGRVVRHHPRLNTYTLTVATTPGSSPPSLQEDVEELRQLIRCHTQKKVSPVYLLVWPSHDSLKDTKVMCVTYCKSFYV